MVAQIGGLVWFLPILSFLLVFVLVYALLKKTEILGDGEVIPLLVSFILSTFFILRSSLVEFVNFNAAWFSVFIVCIFMILLLIGFANKDWMGIDFVKKGWLGWVILVLLIIFFILSSAHVFNWAVNAAVLKDWVNGKWFGFILLIVVAVGVSFVLAKKD